jgi:hypothetical protein
MTAVKRKLPVLLILLGLVCQGAQAQATGRTQREVGHLLDYVAQSGCQFNRNGKWNAGEAARAHLQRKYDYLEKRQLAPDAESFIERAASTSSMSGKPYQVRCAGKAPVPSGPWLSAELQRFRASSPAATH